MCSRRHHQPGGAAAAACKRELQPALKGSRCAKHSPRNTCAPASLCRRPPPLVLPAAHSRRHPLLADMMPEGGAWVPRRWAAAAAVAPFASAALGVGAPAQAGQAAAGGQAVLPRRHSPKRATSGGGCARSLRIANTKRHLTLHFRFVWRCVLHSRCKRELRGHAGGRQRGRRRQRQVMDGPRRSHPAHLPISAWTALNGAV